MVRVAAAIGGGSGLAVVPQLPKGPRVARSVSLRLARASHGRMTGGPSQGSKWPRVPFGPTEGCKVPCLNQNRRNRRNRAPAPAAVLHRGAPECHRNASAGAPPVRVGNAPPRRLGGVLASELLLPSWESLGPSPTPKKKGKMHPLRPHFAEPPVCSTGCCWGHCAARECGTSVGRWSAVIGTLVHMSCGNNNSAVTRSVGAPGAQRHRPEPPPRQGPERLPATGNDPHPLTFTMMMGMQWHWARSGAGSSPQAAPTPTA